MLSRLLVRIHVAMLNKHLLTICLLQISIHHHLDQLLKINLWLPA